MMQQHEQARQAAMDENSNEGTYSYSGTWGGRGRGYKGKHAGCKKLKADFVTDVTIPDRSCYLPSQTLIKTWKMKNSGGIQWDGVTLNFVKGDSAMTMEQRFPVENAKPGDTVDVHAVIQTPDKPGRYCAYYRLCGAGLVSKKAGEGKMFGPRIWTDIIVVKDLQDLKERARLDDGPTREQEKRAKQLRKKAAKVENREDKLKVQVSKLEFQKTKMEAKLKHTQAKLDQVQSTKAKFQNKAEQSTQEKKARKLAKQADKKEKKEAKLRNKLAKMENNLENKQATIAAKRAELEQASDDALLYGHAQEVAEEAIKPSSPMSSPADDEKCDYAVSSAVPSEPAPEAPDMSEQWDCMCGSVTNGNFCGDCGSKRPEKAKVAPPAPFAVIPFKYDAQLSTLLGMGFPDVTLNKFLLNKNDGNVERVVDFLFKQMNA